MSRTEVVLLEVDGVVKTFPGVKALDGVRLRLCSGRLVALLGENGAGKSTLMNIVSGVFAADEGVVRFSGQEVRFSNPREAQECGIGIVHQELNLIPNLSIAENIFLGREPVGRAGLVDYGRLNADAEILLERLGLQVSARAKISDLRVGQQQLVEIAKAISLNTRVLILDEPTSSLSEHEVKTLFAVISDLKREGVGIVYITHKFEELAEICDEVTIMRDGRVVGAFLYEDLNRDELVRLMAGREGKELFQKSVAKMGRELLEVRNVSLAGEAVGRKRLIDDVSVTVRSGEVLGIFGLIGAGRTELLETIFGLHAGRSSGEVLVEGCSVEFSHPSDAIAAGLAFAPEDRKRDGLVLSMSVAENASLAYMDPVLKSGFVRRSLETEYIAPYIDRFRVKTPSLEQLVVNLSGGNQQKVILAKWLATGPKLLLLDEPTRGIDVNAKREIYAFIDELAQKGMGIVVVSSELPEVIALSDRIMVMREGRKSGEFDRSEATPEKVLHAAFPKKVSE